MVHCKIAFEKECHNSKVGQLIVSSSAAKWYLLQNTQKWPLANLSGLKKLRPNFWQIKKMP
jgi:hypothetical protein